MSTDLTTAERRTYYVDANDVVRRYGTQRKRRSDCGKHKPHPAHCQHCESVRTYRTVREASIEANGGIRNENAHHGVITFKEWLIAQSRENKWMNMNCQSDIGETISTNGSMYISTAPYAETA